MNVFGLASLQDLPPMETRPEDEELASQQLLQLDNTENTTDVKE